MAPLTRPVFQRSPRTHFCKPSGEKVEIPPPSSLPQQPGFPWQGLTGGVSLGALYFMNSLGPHKNVANPLVLAATPAIGAIISAIQFLVEKKRYTTKCQEREKNYRAFLEERFATLTRLREEQRSEAQICNPSPGECVRLVLDLDRNLWIRSPRDSDFLSLRLGTGSQSFASKVESSVNDPSLEPDPLILMVQSKLKELVQIADMPVCLPLKESGVVGISGEWDSVQETVRLLVLQLTAHHSPDEVKIVALYQQDDALNWEWMRWLPHTWTDDYSYRFLSRTDKGNRELLKKMQDMVSRRKLSGRTEELRAITQLPFFVFLFSDSQMAVREPLVGQLLSYGSSVGALTVFLSPKEELLPKGCQALLSVGKESAELKLLAGTMTSLSYARDTISLEKIDEYARAMAPISLQKIVAHDSLPTLVTLFEMFNCRQVQELDILSLWKSSEPYQSLAVPVGKTQGGDPFFLNIHEKTHGIHGLVAGTTGSGKSEFLQSFVTALATHFHPHELSFLFVDFKGGGTAKIFNEIPHLVGAMTNLEGNLVERARVSIDGERRRREKLLAARGVNSINEYIKKRRQGKDFEPLPLLLIIVDEFAELATEEPEFMKELIKVARVGRSLGMFLILATQKPAGVVNEQIWSNCNYRVCFRVQTAQDSLEVLKCPDAADLTGSGRAYIQVGNNEVFSLFQAAWGGVPFSAGDYQAVDPHEIVEVNLNGTRRSLTGTCAPVAEEARNQGQVLLSYIATLARQAGIERLQGPWLPPLPLKIVLDELQPKGRFDGAGWKAPGDWLRPVVGLLDDPAQQKQGTLVLDLAKAGHMALYGAPGKGKTTFVETLIMSLAGAHTPEELHLYLLDFGGRSLTRFKDLPHTGAVIFPDDRERLERLFRFVTKEMERRKELFASRGVKTLEAYRAAAAEPLPAIVVILDNFAGFANSYPDDDEHLAHMVREGGSLGLHLVVTAHNPNLIRFKITNNITLSATFGLAEKSDYSSALNASGLFSLPDIPGRGLINYKPPLEFQTALPAGGFSESEIDTALRGTIEKMSALWEGKRARPISTLPDVVPLDTLFSPVISWNGPLSLPALAAPVGIDADDLEPYSLSLNEGPHFLVTGPPRSGKSTFLQTAILSLASHLGPDALRFILVDFHSRLFQPFKNLPHLKACCSGDEDLDKNLQELTQELQSRADAVGRGQAREQDFPAILLIVDDFETFINESFSAKEKLGPLLKAHMPGFHCLVSAQSQELASNWDELASQVKKFRAGLLLGSSDQSDLDLLGIQLPFGRAAGNLAAGTGYFAKHQKCTKIKIASPSHGKTVLAGWVEMIEKKRG
jgi:DNA segregation ATPase FtsK/SpoIIIE, S-DNA-T family